MSPSPSKLNPVLSPSPPGNPNPRPQGDRLSRRISTPALLRQFLAQALVSGIFHAPREPPGHRQHIEKPGNLHILNSVLQSLSTSSSPGNAVFLYDAMRREGIVPDSYTIPFALGAMGRLRLAQRGRATHCSSLILGLESDVFVQNALVHMYFLCGLEADGRRVFELVPESVRDVVSWNSLISGYLQSGQCEEALRVFRGMMMGRDSVGPDTVTLVNALVACGRVGKVGLGRQVHGHALKNAIPLDVYMGSSLTDMYAKCGFIEDARRVFDGMDDRNVVCWTSMISGYTNEGRFKDSLVMFREMQTQGVRADAVTLACAISACAQLGALDLGKWVHAYCDVNGLGKNIKVKNTLIDMYSKCGDVERALQIFHGLACPDVFSWTAMICGLALNGCAEEALSLFLEMEASSKVTPNDVTFLGVLSACSHGGLVERGFYHFHRMTSFYKLPPKLQHFGCMVDLLGRARLLGDAEELVAKMPIKPDVVIWRSLLFAYMMNRNVEKAEDVVKRITEQELTKSGVHVLLSNIYASASRWSDATRVRKVMRKTGITKQPGCSFIEINGVVHDFFAGDLSHSQTELIHEALLTLTDLMSSEGYVSDSPGWLWNGKENA